MNPALGWHPGDVHQRAGRDDLSATISALEQTGESQTLSAPRLTVLNNRPATISDGKVQYYYEEYTVKSTVQQYYTASSICPQRQADEDHRRGGVERAGQHQRRWQEHPAGVESEGEYRRAAGDLHHGEPITTQSGNVQSTLRHQAAAVPHPGTLHARRGQVRRDRGDGRRAGAERSTYVESVPVLGDIPIIGALFRRRTEMDSRVTC